MGGDEGLGAVAENAAVELVPQIEIFARAGHGLAPDILAKDVVNVLPLKYERRVILMPLILRKSSTYYVLSLNKICRLKLMVSGGNLL